MWGFIRHIVLFSSAKVIQSICETDDDRVTKESAAPEHKRIRSEQTMYVSHPSRVVLAYTSSTFPGMLTFLVRDDRSQKGMEPYYVDRQKAMNIASGFVV